MSFYAAGPFVQLNCERLNSGRTCLQCNKFFTEKGLVHHEKIVHNRTLNCSVCDKAFGKKSGLEHHIKMVHGEKNHKCALCNDAFPTGGLWSF